MKSLRIILAALGLALASVAVPQAAQAQCTYKCGCISGGCACHEAGGRGGSCDASGNGCFVGKCSSPVQPVAFAPDGGVLVAGDEAAAADAHPASAARRTDVGILSTATWEQVAPGHAVARGCGDVILAQWYAPEAADAVRASSRRLLL